MMIRSHHLVWLIPLICALLLIPLGSWIDLTIARSFFEIEGQQFKSFSVYDFVFDYGPVPAEIVSVGAIFFLFFKKWRKPALLLVLTMIIGVAALVHGVFKDHWGRPRPKQVIEFGGRQEFRPFYDPNLFHKIEPSKSFPCGHCSMGFYFLALIPLGIRYRNKALLWGGALTSLFLGGILGWIRMAQGGHFFTDVVFSGLIMWATVLVLDWLIWPVNGEGYEGAY